jgi:yersiniabactin nonribosomal peptide synthetase
VDELFPESFLNEAFAAYLPFLNRLAHDEEAWKAPALSLVPEEQLAPRLTANATAGPVPEGLLHAGFLEQAERRPFAPAVVSLTRVLSYQDLERRSLYLAGELRRQGARPGTLVGVVMEKGWEQVVAVLAVLRAGAAYLPIDPNLPAERLGYLLEHGQVEIALTQSWVDEELAWPEGVARLRVDTAPPAGPGEPPLPAAQSPEDLAYVIFTSGSTGLPKGVMIDHRGALNTVIDVNRRFGVGPGDRVLALSALNFDLSVWDIFGILAAGGTVVLPEPGASRDPGRWLELIAEEGVTVWNTVPALMEMLVEFARGQGSEALSTLRLVMMSGDWIPLSLPPRIKALAPEAEVFGLGGATEASIWSYWYEASVVDPSWRIVSFGWPLTKQGFQVLVE